jgi:hypothetical protein
VNRNCGSVLAVISMLIVVLPPTQVGAVTYYPLVIGAEWQYEVDGELAGLMSITGHRELMGVTTVIRHEDIYEFGMGPMIVENFWTADATGNLFLHGAINYTYDVEFAYWPPIKMIDAPLELGASWITEDIYRFDLDGNPLGGSPFDYPLAVHFEGQTEVPLGSFYTYGVGFDYGAPPLYAEAGRQYDILGRRLSDGSTLPSGEPTHWYEEDVGLAQWRFTSTSSDTFKLAEHQTSPVSELSWGRTKLLFR